MPEEVLVGNVPLRICDLTVEEFMLCLVRAQMIADGLAMEVAKGVIPTPLPRVRVVIERFVARELRGKAN